MVRRAALDAVGEALGGAAPTRGPGRPRSDASSPAHAAAPRAAAGRKTKPGGKRPPALLAKTVETLHAHIKAHPGERIEQIGKHLGIKTSALALPVKKLLAAKKISKKGVKRSTQYFPKG